MVDVYGAAAALLRSFAAVALLWGGCHLYGSVYAFLPRGECLYGSRIDTRPAGAAAKLRSSSAVYVNHPPHPLIRVMDVSTSPDYFDK